MTKKHFIALADAIREHNKLQFVATPFTKEQLDTLVQFCIDQNPNFNRSRWIAYIKGECGPNGGSIKTPKPMAEQIAVALHTDSPLTG